MQIFQQVCLTRQQKLPDPARLGNAGSFFKNPVISINQFSELQLQYPQLPHYPAGTEVKLAAGWLIDQCQLKGYRIGGAQVHQQQALVIVNCGGALAQDVVLLAKYVQDQVYQRFGVQLEHEVRFIGKAGETTLAEVCHG